VLSSPQSAPPVARGLQAQTQRRTCNGFEGCSHHNNSAVCQFSASALSRARPANMELFCVGQDPLCASRGVQWCHYCYGSRPARQEWPCGERSRLKRHQGREPTCPPILPPAPLASAASTGLPKTRCQRPSNGIATSTTPRTPTPAPGQRFGFRPGQPFAPVALLQLRRPATLIASFVNCH